MKKLTFDSLPESVQNITKLHIEGNVIPHSWYQHIQSNGRPNLAAIIILADIVYWYRAAEVRDEDTGKILGFKRKFAADMLQKSYPSIAAQFGLSKDQVIRAVRLLKSLNLIRMEYRNIIIGNGIKVTNVTFMEPIHSELIKITYDHLDSQGVCKFADTPSESCRHPNANLQTPSCENPRTNTEITTKTTTEISKVLLRKTSDTSAKAEVSTDAPQHFPSISEVPSLATKKRSVDIPEDKKDTVNAIVEMWNARDLRKHHNPSTSMYQNILIRLSKLIDGTMFNGSTPEPYLKYKGRKFKRADFSRSFDEFNLAANSPAHYPPVGKRKEYFKHLSLYDFLWNDRTGESFFIRFLEEGAKNMAEAALREEDSELTDCIIEEYSRQQPSIKKSDLGRKDFIKASNRLLKFFKENEYRLNSVMTPTKKRSADWLVTAVFEAARGKSVPPMFLHTDVTFNQIFPLYLAKENILIEKKQKGSEIHEYKTWIDPLEGIEKAGEKLRAEAEAKKAEKFRLKAEKFAQMSAPNT